MINNNRDHNNNYSVSQKSSPLPKLFSIFSVGLSIFPWYFASKFPVYIHTYLLILVDLSWYLDKDNGRSLMAHGVMKSYCLILTLPVCTAVVHQQTS